jgi:hypothetical protein
MKHIGWSTTNPAEGKAPLTIQLLDSVSWCITSYKGVISFDIPVTRRTLPSMFRLGYFVEMTAMFVECGTK